MIDVDAVARYLSFLQHHITASLIQLDPVLQSKQTQWQRKNGGSGKSQIVQNGALFERAGIHFSHIHGERLPASASASRPELAGRQFQALGISLIIHPLSPYIPTTHMNIRFFIASKRGEAAIWWFGGGFDLTPYYPFIEDVRHWHNTAKKACTRFGHDTYKKYKKWCDDYFYIKHRKEARGVGGLFFDDLNSMGFARCFALAKNVADHFLPAYLPIVQRRKKLRWGERERQFQCYRRGRYVEFNLVYDRGTLFGLQTGGQIESILASLPPVVHWQYDWQPEPGSPEADLYDNYLTPKDWADPH